MAQRYKCHKHTDNNCKYKNNKMKKKNYLAPAIEVIPVNKVSLCNVSYIEMEEYEEDYEDDLTMARTRKQWWER